MDMHSLYLVAIGVAVGFVLGRASSGTGNTCVMRPPDSPFGGGPKSIGQTRELTPDAEANIRTLLKENRKIEALKAYRVATNVSLKEAKEAVDRMLMQ